MNKKEKAIAIAVQALEELTLELAREQGVNQSQLLQFKRHLEKIIWQLENDQLPEKSGREFGLGQAVIDSWPLGSSLGNLLCSAEQAYRNV